MTNPKCLICGHVNLVGAASCAMCDTRFADPAGEGASASGAYVGGFEAAREGFNAFGEETRPGSLPTDIPSPQFKGVADVLSPTLQVFQKNFLLVGLLVLVTTLPPALLQYASTSTFGATSEDDLFGMLAGGVVALLSWALSLFGNALLAGALACAVVEIQRTGAARAGECLRWGLGKTPKVFAVTVVTTLLLYVPGVTLGFLTALLGPAVLILMLLLLLPWIVLMLTISLGVPVAAVENRGIIDSLRRSAELTNGFKGLLFLTYFLWRIVIIITMLVVWWSIASGGGENSLTGVVLYTLVVGMLESSASVLVVYTFLGILTERRQGFAPTISYAPEPAGR